MKYKTYYQLKEMTRQELLNKAFEEGLIEEVETKKGSWYLSKATILEILSVNHREWQTA